MYSIQYIDIYDWCGATNDIGWNGSAESKVAFAGIPIVKLNKYTPLNTKRLRIFNERATIRASKHIAVIPQNFSALLHAISVILRWSNTSIANRIALTNENSGPTIDSLISIGKSSVADFFLGMDGDSK